MRFNLDKFKKIVKKYNLQKVLAIIFITYLVAVCLLWAAKMQLNTGPDEFMKYDIINYISEHMTLPHGGDEAIREANWGISYAFTPYTPYIIAGVLVHFVKIFTASMKVTTFVSRLVSIAFFAGYVVFMIKISKKVVKGIMRVFFIVLTTCIPQLIFLGSYINNDSMALFSIAMIVYAWLIGLETKWSWKSCILLAIGIGVCALSYYNAYGYILCSLILYVGTCFVDKVKFKTFLAKGLSIFAVAFVIAGWFFVRNAFLYNGDFLGLNTSREYAEAYAEDDLKPSQRGLARQGLGYQYMLEMTSWKASTRRSFYGGFGPMSVFLRNDEYLVYETITMAGIFGFLAYIIYIVGVKLYALINKKQTAPERLEMMNFKISNKSQIIFHCCMLLCAIIPVILSIYYSYNNDYQPQGRYIMPMIIPLMYYVVKGYEFIFGKGKSSVKTVLLSMAIIFMVIMPVYCYFVYIAPFFSW